MGEGGSAKVSESVGGGLCKVSGECVGGALQREWSPRGGASARSGSQGGGALCKMSEVKGEWHSIELIPYIAALILIKIVFSV